MANNGRQNDDIIHNYEPFIQNKLSKLPTAKKTKSCPNFTEIFITSH